MNKLYTYLKPKSEEDIEKEIKRYPITNLVCKCICNTNVLIDNIIYQELVYRSTFAIDETDRELAKKYLNMISRFSRFSE